MQSPTHISLWLIFSRVESGTYCVASLLSFACFTLPGAYVEGSETLCPGSVSMYEHFVWWEAAALQGRQDPLAWAIQYLLVQTRS